MEARNLGARYDTPLLDWDEVLAGLDTGFALLTVEPGGATRWRF
jgi:hypothetical protein